MGMWSFVKDAGKSLFGSKAEAAEAPKEDVLKDELKQLGLDAKGVDLKVVGDKVVVSGKAIDAETQGKDHPRGRQYRRCGDGGNRP